MSEYGYYTNKKHEKKGVAWWVLPLYILDAVMLFATVICYFFLICAYISKFVVPEGGYLLAFSGLLFPVFYTTGIILALYWIIRWRKTMMIICILLLLAGIGNARLFYQFDLRKRYDEQAPLRNERVVMSYNVMNFNYPYADKSKSQIEHIAVFIKDNNVDVVCFQEFNDGDKFRDALNAAVPDLKYSYFVNYNGGNRYGQGLAIYSKHPIINSGVVKGVDTALVRSIWADIRIKRDTVRLVNNHLQSTYVSGSDVDYLSSFRVVSDDGDQIKQKIKEIARKMNNNYLKRAPQAEAIATFIQESPYPVIVCGDFNDTPVSYTYRTISKDLTDSFVSKGYGAKGTYNGFFNMFRIDYILMSDGLDVLNYYPFDVLYSDHNPIAASFDFVKK